MSRLPHRWRTQQTAKRNANCRTRESSNFWTHVALVGNPTSIPVWVSVFATIIRNLLGGFSDSGALLCASMDSGTGWTSVLYGKARTGPAYFVPAAFVSNGLVFVPPRDGDTRFRPVWGGAVGFEFCGLLCPDNTFFWRYPREKSYWCVSCSGIVELHRNHCWWVLVLARKSVGSPEDFSNVLFETIIMRESKACLWRNSPKVRGWFSFWRSLWTLCLFYYLVETFRPCAC